MHPAIKQIRFTPTGQTAVDLARIDERRAARKLSEALEAGAALTFDHVKRLSLVNADARISPAELAQLVGRAQAIVAVIEERAGAAIPLHN